MRRSPAPRLIRLSNGKTVDNVEWAGRMIFASGDGPVKMSFYQVRRRCHAELTVSGLARRCPHEGRTGMIALVLRSSRAAAGWSRALSRLARPLPAWTRFPARSAAVLYKRCINVPEPCSQRSSQARGGASASRDSKLLPRSRRRRTASDILLLSLGCPERGDRCGSSSADARAPSPKQRGLTR